MAIDQNVTPAIPETNPSSPIENEIPAYRAISPLAIISLLFGALSLLSFAHWMFLGCAVAAVVLGFLADRKIRRYSDVLTGRGIAQAGIALGMTFGLASLTASTVQSYLRTSSAGRFAATYAQVLQDKTFEDALWYQAPPTQRKGMTGEQVAKEMKQGGPDPSAFEMANSSLRGLKTRLAKDKDTKVRFVGIESHGADGLAAFASALLQLTEPDGNHAHAEDEFALVLLKAENPDGRYEWKVEELRFPYKPNSYTPPSKPVDDGHGHAH